MKRSIYPVLAVIFMLVMMTPFNMAAQDDGVGEENPTPIETGDEEEADVNETRINWDKVLKDWSVGVNIGVTMPYTDVRSYDWFRKTKPVSEYQYGFGADITKMIGGVFGIQGRYMYGKLQGFSNYQSGFQEDVQFWEIVGIEDPFYFTTQFHQASMNVYMNFSNMFLGLNKRIRAKIKDKEMKERRVSVYGRAGIGAIWFESDLQDLETGAAVGNQFGMGFSGSAVELAFPFALGLKFKVSHLIDIHFEGEFTFVHDDKLDAFIIEDVTKDQYILDILNNDGIPADRVRNSLGGRYDKHLFVNAGINFKFGTLKSQKEHLEWVNPLEAYADDNDRKVQYLLDNMYEVKDADDDGVIDELDREPESAPEAHVNTHGVTMDSDGDGLADHEDPEPFSTSELPIVDGKNVYPETMTPEDIKEYVDGQVGEVKEYAKKNALGWSLSMVFFDLDKSKIKTEMIPELYHVAEVMQKHPELKVDVKGHTDVRDTNDYNLNLSEERTAAAIDYMVEKYGISRDRFVAGFFGESDNLIDDAKRESEHLLNRRVEFTPANY